MDIKKQLTLLGSSNKIHVSVLSVVLIVATVAASLGIPAARGNILLSALCITVAGILFALLYMVIPTKWVLLCGLCSAGLAYLLLGSVPVALLSAAYIPPAMACNYALLRKRSRNAAIVRMTLASAVYLCIVIIVYILLHSHSLALSALTSAAGALQTRISSELTIYIRAFQDAFTSMSPVSLRDHYSIFTSDPAVYAGRLVSELKVFAIGIFGLFFSLIAYLMSAAVRRVILATRHPDLLPDGRGGWTVQMGIWSAAVGGLALFVLIFGHGDTWLPVARYAAINLFLILSPGFFIAGARWTFSFMRHTLKINNIFAFIMIMAAVIIAAVVIFRGVIFYGFVSVGIIGTVGYWYTRLPFVRDAGNE